MKLVFKLTNKYKSVGIYPHVYYAQVGSASKCRVFKLANYSRVDNISVLKTGKLILQTYQGHRLLKWHIDKERYKVLWSAKPHLTNSVGA